MRVDSPQFKLQHKGWECPEAHNFVLLFMTSLFHLFPTSGAEENSPFCLTGDIPIPAFSRRARVAKQQSSSGCRKGSFFVSAFAPSPAFSLPTLSFSLKH